MITTELTKRFQTAFVEAPAGRRFLRDSARDSSFVVFAVCYQPVNALAIAKLS
jgi:hypothetical protein